MNIRANLGLHLLPKPISRHAQHHEQLLALSAAQYHWHSTTQLKAANLNCRFAPAITKAIGWPIVNFHSPNCIVPIFSLIVLIFGMSVLSALFTDSQSRLFIWLFGQPERAFHLNELRRLTGLGSASLQRELNRLAVAGLVDSQPVANMRRFQANAQSPVFAELVALTRKTLGTVPVLRDALLPLTPDLQAAWVYGSVAKQTDTARSDIDVMLVGRNLSLSNVLACLAPAEAQLGRKINPGIYLPEEFERRCAEPDSFVNRVLSQPTLALIGDAHEHARAG